MSGRTDALAEFVMRLGAIEPLLRVVVPDDSMRLLMTFRGDPERTVLLDFSSHPLRVEVGDPARSANVWVTADGEVMHQVLTERLAAGEAFGRRELLLRGSAVRLAGIIPFLGFAPILYREHLAHRRPAPEEDEMNTVERSDRGGRLSRRERAIHQALNGVAWTAGFGLGVLRYRVLEHLDLFVLLEHMSLGLRAAEAEAAVEPELVARGA